MLADEIRAGDQPISNLRLKYPREAKSILKVSLHLLIRQVEKSL